MCVLKYRSVCWCEKSYLEEVRSAGPAEKTASRQKVTEAPALSDRWEWREWTEEVKEAARETAEVEEEEEEEEEED